MITIRLLIFITGHKNNDNVLLADTTETENNRDGKEPENE